MTWTYRIFKQGGETVYAQLEDESGDIVRRYYPLPHPQLRDIPDVANGDEHLPNDDVPAIGVRGFSENIAIKEMRDRIEAELPADDSETVTAGMMRRVMSVIDRDVERVEVEYQGDPVNRGWDRNQNPATNPEGPGQGRGGPP